MNRFEFHGHSLDLLSDGAVFIPETSTLVVADLHLGKSAVFRAKGLPLQEGDVARDLARLADLARLHGAAELVIAGDLFHGPVGITPEIDQELGGFLEELECPLHLVRGNHDAEAGKLPCGLAAERWLERAGVTILHDPADADGRGLSLAGHWHPIARIPDGKRTSLRLPCFLLRKRVLVLPAFGSFTGGAVMEPETGDRFFMPLHEQVVELPRELLRK
jgi:DNA ligase-associated metallophosphoesterase